MKPWNRQTARREPLGRTTIPTVLALGMAAITAALHAGVAGRDPGGMAAAVHLYDLPIALAALWRGRTWGMLVALVAAVSSLLASWRFHRLSDRAGWAEMGVAIVVFLALGYLVAHASEMLRVRARDWHAVTRVLSSLSEPLDLDESLQMITRRVMEFSGADACAVRLRREGSHEFFYAKTRGLSGAYLNKGPLTVQDSPLLQQAVGGDDIAIPDVREASGLPYRTEMLAEGILALLTVPLHVQDQMIGLLTMYWKRERAFSERERELARTLADQAALVIRNAQRHAALRDDFVETVRVLVAAYEAGDAATLGHSERVARLAQRLGRTLALSPDEQHLLLCGGFLHDIGKIGLHEQLLKRDRPLALEEERLMEMHPLIGKTVIEAVASLLPCAPIVMSHHERWDGGGYPQGLAGTNIPLLARIVAAADRLDHLMQAHARDAAGVEAALEELRKDAGTRCDPNIVQVFVAMMQREEAPAEPSPST